MRSITITELRRSFSRVADEIGASGEPVVVTRHGVPVARIEPPVASPRRALGALAGTYRITGDIMVPSSDLVQWKALE